MEKKKESRRSAKLIVVLVALLLVACSLLGVTLARYVTQGKPGTAGVGVASWNITATEAGNDEAEFPLTLFSPNMAKYVASSDRSRSMEDVAILQIKNDGDVGTYVSLTMGEVNAYAPNSDTPIDFNSTDNRGAGEADYYKPWKESWDDIFTFTWSLECGAGEKSATVPEAVSDGGDYNDMYYVEAGHTLFVYATIAWTTDLDTDPEYTPDEFGCVWSDYRDTWIGQNVEKVGLAYSWYAVQGSQLPDEGASSQN